MKKTHIFSLAFLAFSAAATVHAEEKRYISDELSTWVRSGPGNDYRLVGTLNAGEQVTLLQSNENSKYGQIRDSQGRTTWIPLSQLSEQPSLRSRVPELEQQVKDLTARLANIDNSWNERTADMQKKVAGSDDAINSLKAENQQLKNQLVVASKKVDAANVQLDDKQRTIIMQWFMYGGGVAGFGLLLGLLLPHMLPRRKKNDRWMN
ncbi:TIGR04211 family SH3 domain-containing protein [Erwiniaceae bacterium CAU 1747]